MRGGKGKREMGTTSSCALCEGKKNKNKYTPMKICKHWRNTFPLFFEAEFNE